MKLKNLKSFMKNYLKKKTNSVAISREFGLIAEKLKRLTESFQNNMDKIEYTVEFLKSKNIEHDREIQKQIDILNKKKSLYESAEQSYYLKSISLNRMKDKKQQIQSSAEHLKFNLNDSIKTIERWNKNVAQGKIDGWNNSDLDCFLQSIELGKWSKAFQTHGIRPDSVHRLNLKELMRITLDGVPMTFGEAKYILLCLKQISEEKSIPQTPEGDENLSISKVNNWTILDVQKYFIKQGKTSIGNCLLRKQINGFVLFSIETEEIELLELNDFSEITYLARELEKFKKKIIPENFICPLTKKVMADPVMIITGYTFERNAIENYFKSQRICPVTRCVVDDINLRPNFSLKRLIIEWQENNS
eukprot:c17410_g1_i1.p1 GENE.c17410_g1_i1~~c17410_g1_i1.p1  ORF type:complete len:361 (-),score=136.52 c17410_g1_i1:61-1143(-)